MSSMRIGLMGTAIVLGSISLANPVSAAFIAVDNFESYATGTIVDGGANWNVEPNSITGNVFAPPVQTVVDPAGAPGNRALAIPANAQLNSAVYSLSPSLNVANGSTGTVFFRMYLSPSQPINFSFGLTPVTAGVDFNSFGPQFRLNGTNSALLDTRDGASFVGLDGAPTLAAGNWYNMWLVADNATDTSRLLIQSSTDANFAAQTEVLLSGGSNPINFRTSTANPLISLRILTGQQAVGPVVYIDDVSFAAGTDLTNPVPEPTTLSLLGLGGLAMLRRRRA